MRGKNISRFFRLLTGLMLFSILVYGILNMMQEDSQAVLPKQSPTPSPTPTPTPTPEATPTPTPEATPTPTPTTPPSGKYEIQTIPQDDQLRQKGIMILCPNPGGFPCYDGPDNTRLLGFFGTDEFFVNVDTDLHAEYKVDFRLNGVNTDPDEFECVVLEKDVCNPKTRQFPFEEEKTIVIDVSDFFLCKFRKSPNEPGVGVIDVYTLALFAEQFIADHIFKIEASVGNVHGSEIQDLCILGFPTCRFFDQVGGGECYNDFKDPNFFFSVESSGETFFIYADPLWPFASCKTASLWQRFFVLGSGFLPTCLQ